MIPRWINGKDGSTTLSDVIRYTKGGFSSPGIPVGQTQPVIVIPPAGGMGLPTSAPSVVVEAGADEVAELFSSMGVHGNPQNAVPLDTQLRMSVQITDVAYRRRLMNRPILVDHVFGTNLQPFFFRESTLLESQQTMLFDFNNNSTAGSTYYQFALEKRKFQAVALTRSDVTNYIGEMRRRKMFLSPFWLTSDDQITVNPLGQGSVGPQTDAFFTVTNDMYGILFGAICTVIAPFGTTGLTGECFVAEFFDAKTERPLQNQPIARSCCSGGDVLPGGAALVGVRGTAGYPFIFPTGWIIEPNTKIHMKFSSLLANNPLEIFWTFIGVSAYCNKNPLQYPEVDVSVNSDVSVGAP